MPFRRVARSTVSLLLCVAMLFVSSGHALADDMQPKNKGLFISPLREYTTIDPGKVKSGTLTVANITDKPITVTLSVGQFSVADYTYDYAFETVKDDWVKLSAVQVRLSPNKSQVISYSVAPPPNVTPGGHYFTIFAATNLENGSLTSRVRAATILYVTINGDLRRSSEIASASIPRIFFGSNVDFTLNVKNTGNTHFFIFVSGWLNGLSAKGERAEATHILLPGTTRTVDGTIAAPLLPGVYKAIYGYKTDNNQTVQRSSYIVYLPPWSLAIPLGIVGLLVVIRRRVRT